MTNRTPIYFHNQNPKKYIMVYVLLNLWIFFLKIQKIYKILLFWWDVS